MEIIFHAIGLEIANEIAFNHLAEDARIRGEASKLARRKGILHGRCLKFGEGLEVWSVLFETAEGDIFSAGCRAGFRAKYPQEINPWLLSEYAEEGEAMIHGFIKNTESEVLFQLQNITEVGMGAFNSSALRIGLCGLAYHAEVNPSAGPLYWKQSDEFLGNLAETEANEWSFKGKIREFEVLKNRITGNELFWFYLQIEDFALEVLVNRKNFKGLPEIGAIVSGELWLQGHIFAGGPGAALYEGADLALETSDFWKHLRRKN